MESVSGYPTTIGLLVFLCQLEDSLAPPGARRLGTGASARVPERHGLVAARAWPVQRVGRGDFAQLLVAIARCGCLGAVRFL